MLDKELCCETGQLYPGQQFELYLQWKY